MTEAEWLVCEDAVKMLAWLQQKPHPVSDRKLLLFAKAAGCVNCLAECILNTAADYAAFVAEASCSTRQRKVAVLRDIVGNPYQLVRLSRHTIRCEACDGTGRIRAYRIGILVESSPCYLCNARGEREGPRECITPDVLAVAKAAYDCASEDGTLDSVRLSILADALEEASLSSHERVACPRCGPWHGHPDSPEPAGYHPERDPASGKHEGGWTTCQECNGVRSGLPGTIMRPHPILVHLRSSGPHVRGCWAVDLILGRE